MAWAKEIDAARTHLATVLAEFSKGMDARVREGGPGIGDEERAFKDFLTGTILTMSEEMFKAVPVELSVIACHYHGTSHASRRAVRHED